MAAPTIPAQEQTTSRPRTSGGWTRTIALTMTTTPADWTASSTATTAEMIYLTNASRTTIPKILTPPNTPGWTSKDNALDQHVGRREPLRTKL